VVPTATNGCAAWDYGPAQLQKLEGTQIKMLRAIMQQNENKTFSMLTAMNKATEHHWYHLLPIAAKVEAIQIKFLRHLLTTVSPNTQLHIICRCRVLPLSSETTDVIGTPVELPNISYASTIDRTRKYYNLDELLHVGYIEGNYLMQCTNAAARNLPPPPSPFPIMTPHPPWYISICNSFFTKQRLTELLKSEGKKEFINTWRRHQFEQLRKTRFDKQNNCGTVEYQMKLGTQIEEDYSDLSDSSDSDESELVNMVHTLLPQRQNRTMTITTYFENKVTVIEDDDDENDGEEQYADVDQNGEMEKGKLEGLPENEVLKNDSRRKWLNKKKRAWKIRKRQRQGQ
jgi:hypothetical protein